MAVRPYKRKGEIQPNKWLIDYYDAKRVRQRMIFVGTRAEADATEADLRKQHAAGPRNNPTINGALPGYLEWLKIHRAKRTYEDVCYSLKHLKPHFGPYQVNRISRQLIQDYKVKRGDIPRSINKELIYLQSIIAWMVREELCYPLPFKIEKVPYKRPLPKIPHPTEIERFIEAFDDPRKKALVALLYDAGLRWEEGSTITWEEIDWRNAQARICGKGGKYRIALLSDRVLSLLDLFRAASGYVFANPKTGRPWSHIRRAWKTAETKAGVKLNPHLLRHAYATYTLEACGDLRAVQTALGHSDITTSEIYTHVSMRRQQQVAKMRSEYLKTINTQPAAKPENEDFHRHDRPNETTQPIDIKRFIKPGK